VINAVKEKMKDVEKGLPEGVHFKIAYDRSTLIEAAIANIKGKLGEEMLAVSIIVILFLFHWRSALSIIIQIPITIAASFILLNAFGISSNIMSLTGIALAIGVIVDNGRFDAERSGELFPHFVERSRLGGPGFVERAGGNARITYLREVMALGDAATTVLLPSINKRLRPNRKTTASATEMQTFLVMDGLL